MKIIKLIFFLLLFSSITTICFADTDVYVTNGSNYMLRYVIITEKHVVVKEGTVGVDERAKTKLPAGNYEIVWWKHGQEKFRKKTFSIEEKNALVAIILLWPQEKIDGTFSKTPENFSLAMDRNNFERR